MGKELRLGRLSKRLQVESPWAAVLWETWKSDTQGLGKSGAFRAPVPQSGFWPTLESPSSGILFPLGTGPKKGIPSFIQN